MEKKDLADEYAEKEYKRVNGDSEPIFTDETCFTFEDIKYAFDAGRESVVESIPELKWKDEDRRGDEENYIEESYSLTPFGDYSILKWYAPTDITIYFNGEHFKSGITSVQQAKQAANEDYKKRIKQALGL